VRVTAGLAEINGSGEKTVKHRSSVCLSLPYLKKIHELIARFGPSVRGRYTFKRHFGRVNTLKLVWRRGVEVSGFRRMNEVNPRRAR